MATSLGVGGYQITSLPTGGGGGTAYSYNADALTFSLTLGTETPAVQRQFSAAGLSFALTLGTETGHVVRNFSAAPLSFALTLGSATEKVARAFAAPALSLSLTLGTMTMTYTPGGGSTAYSYSADPLSFVLFIPSGKMQVTLGGDTHDGWIPPKKKKPKRKGVQPITDWGVDPRQLGEPQRGGDIAPSSPAFSRFFPAPSPLPSDEEDEEDLLTIVAFMLAGD